MYGFKKIKRDNKDLHVFHHEYFQRDRPDLLLHIRRSTNNGKRGNYRLPAHGFEHMWIDKEKSQENRHPVNSQEKSSDDVLEGDDAQILE